ncbi:MAG: IclR family transcriptional regulator [Candidatus Geothermincolia bacterium]
MPKQIQSIERGLYVLETIMFNDKPITGTELARRLGVHKSTVSHLTSTLCEQGYLAKEPGTSRLVRGPKLYRVARAVGMSGEQILKVPPALASLSESTGETAHLAELRGRYVIYLVNEYPRQTLRVQTETGAVEAAHSTAVGKAMLAFLAEEEVRAMYEGVKMERYTPKTLVSVDRLLAGLAEIRELGYATDHGEQTAGTGCVAAPVRDALGMVVAAVGISGPEERVFVGGTPYYPVLEWAHEVEMILSH